MRPTVLILDDDPKLVALIEAAFAKDGFHTYAANNGALGVKLFHGHHPRLVVTDIIMPEKEGIETIIELRRAPRPPRIIAISGGGKLAGRDFLRWAKELGADEVMLKPFPMAALVAAGRRLLRADETPPPPNHAAQAQAQVQSQAGLHG